MSRVNVWPGLGALAVLAVSGCKGAFEPPSWIENPATTTPAATVATTTEPPAATSSATATAKPAVANTTTATSTAPPPPPSDTGTTTPTGGRQTCDSSTPDNPHIRYALGILNRTRANHGVPPVALDTVNGACALRSAQDNWACSGGNLIRAGSCTEASWDAGNHCNCRKSQAGIGVKENDESFLTFHDYYYGQGPGTKGYNVFTNPMFTTVAIAEFVDSKGTVWIVTLWK